MQQWVANKISNILGIPCGKDCLIASREMGQSGVDVRLIGEALEKFPYSIECKNQETWSVPAWIEQAKSNEKKGTTWLLICKKNHKDPIIIMDAEKFFDLISRLIKES